MRLYAIRSPYLYIRDETHDFDRVAIAAGMVKNSAESLLAQIRDIARLTAVTAPQEEVRARELLETMIASKRTYMTADAQRRHHHIYETID